MATVMVFGLETKRGEKREREIEDEREEEGKKKQANPGRQIRLEGHD